MWGTQLTIKVEPDYISISAIADICEPWIEIWSGDEWGESLRAAHSATHTDYGLSDEDCATIAEIVVRNVIEQKVWMDEEGRDYELSSDELEATAAQEAREQRDYWLKGGNLGEWRGAPDIAKRTIDQLPGWLFGE